MAELDPAQTASIHAEKLLADKTAVVHASSSSVSTILLDELCVPSPLTARPATSSAATREPSPEEEHCRQRAQPSAVATTTAPVTSSGMQAPPPGSLRGPKQDTDEHGNATDLGTFYRRYPSFILGPMALATLVYQVCQNSPTMLAKLEDGRHAAYGPWDTLVYTIFAILATYASHGYFCVHVAQERQLQEYERFVKDANGKRLPKPAEGTASMRYSERPPPRGASVRSTAALLTSWVYMFYPFAAPTTSWAAFVGWTCVLSVYWDAHFFFFHKAVHEVPKLYKIFHKLHHYYTAPDVFGAYYVTYQSHFMTEQLVLLLAAFAGLPRDVFTWVMFLGTFDTCVKHAGHDISSTARGLPFSYETLMTILNPWSLVLGGATAREHDWHHEKFRSNYALSFTYLDKLCGSYNSGRTGGEAVGLSSDKGGRR